MGLAVLSAPFPIHSVSLSRTVPHYVWGERERREERLSFPSVPDSGERLVLIDGGGFKLEIKLIVPIRS
jgi:hypothetical protein